MEAIVNSMSHSLIIEGFTSLVLFMILCCLVYQSFENKEKIWRLFLCYVASLLLSQLFDISYKLYSPGEYFAAAERVLSTVFGFTSFIFTAIFVFEYIAKSRPVNKALKSVILLLLAATMLCSLFLKCIQVLDLKIGQEEIDVINFTYNISFAIAMLLEVFVIVIYRKALAVFDAVVFLVIPPMHLFISWLPGLSFNFQYLVRNVISTILSILVLGISMVQQSRAFEIQKEHSQIVSDALDKYVGPAVAREILSDNTAQYDERNVQRNITVMFADIQGYTRLCELMEPAEALELLNKCLSVMDECVTKYSGVLDKYIGDCCMAFWNGVDKQKDAELLACKCALEIREGIKLVFSGEKYKNFRNITVNIGINSGSAIVGNVGSKHRMSFSVIGDTVNIAERIQSEAHDGRIYISDSVFRKLKNLLRVDFVGDVLLQGKRSGTAIYELERRD